MVRGPLQNREGLAAIVGVDIRPLHRRVVTEAGHRHEADLALSKRVYEQSTAEKARREVTFEILAQFGAGTLDEGRVEPDVRPGYCVLLEAQDRYALLIDARHTRNRPLDPLALGRRVRFQPRCRWARHCASVEPETMVGSPCLALGRLCCQVQIIVERPTYSGV